MESEQLIARIFALDTMGARDLRLVRADKRASSHDVVAADDEAVDAVRAGEHQAGDVVVGAAELEPVRPPDGEVGLLARLERADVVAP